MFFSSDIHLIFVNVAKLQKLFDFLPNLLLFDAFAHQVLSIKIENASEFMLLYDYSVNFWHYVAVPLQCKNNKSDDYEQEFQQHRESW